MVDLVARVQAGAVEERGAAAGAVGRRVREQPARCRIRRRGSRGEQAIGGRLFVLRKGRSRTIWSG